MTKPVSDGPDLEFGPEAREALRQVARRHGVRLLVAFGSRVSGRAHAGSDLDLAVLQDRPQVQDELQLIVDLQAALPASDVDVVWLDRADPLIAWHALQRPYLLVGDPSELALHQLYAWRRFVEYTPFFELEARAVRRAIARRSHVRR